LNGEDAYKVVITSKEREHAVAYYDVKSGLKIKAAATSDLSHIEYSDYKIFDGYKLPTKLVMVTDAEGEGEIHEWTVTIKNYQINPILTNADFK
ncbi:MAG: outer membrane lipoprotein-sorting protein, partial [Flavobacteriaceae bacterium]|nr:outer membrane lipoprotein-sorting protein [Flavobacteriaceae bacterium]